jgi:hypothetical protein
VVSVSVLAGLLSVSSATTGVVKPAAAATPVPAPIGDQPGIPAPVPNAGPTEPPSVTPLVSAAPLPVGDVPVEVDDVDVPDGGSVRPSGTAKMPVTVSLTIPPSGGHLD